MSSVVGGDPSGPAAVCPEQNKTRPAPDTETPWENPRAFDHSQGLTLSRCIAGSCDSFQSNARRMPARMANESARRSFERDACSRSCPNSTSGMVPGRRRVSVLEVSPDNRDAIASVFDAAAADYDSVGVDFFQPIADRLVEELAPQQGERAIDIGCGSG